MQRAHAGRGWRPLGKAWHRVACAQVVFHGMTLCCMVLDGTAQVTEAQVWYGMVCAQLALHCMVRYIGMAWYGMVWCNPKCSSSSESEKPCQRVSNADRKVFANPESFCGKFIIG